MKIINMATTNLGNALVLFCVQSMFAMSVYSSWGQILLQSHAKPGVLICLEQKLWFNGPGPEKLSVAALDF